MARIPRACIWGLLLLGLTALGTACGQPPPWRLGFLGGLSGRVADLGVDGRNGAMLAVERQNAAGGVGGRSLELIARDDGQEPEMARRATSELLGLGVEAIIGPMTSSMAMAALPLLKDTPTVMVSPTVTTTQLMGLDDNFLRVISTTADYAGKSARYQRQRQGRSRAAVIYDLDNASYTQSWLDDFQRAFEHLGGQVVKTLPYTSGDDRTFLPAARELLAAGPDLVVAVTNAVDAALICQQVRRLDPRMPLAMSEWASTERFLELAGAAAEGVCVPQFLNRNDTSERYQAFRRDYQRRFGQDPGFGALAGYDAARVVIETLSRRQAGQGLKEAVIALKSFQGLQQVINIDQYGDADRATYITEIRDGQYLTLE
ncbi:MAG: ABC transporter substrate-binding protein [Pseudomonadota bacterium]